MKLRKIFELKNNEDNPVDKKKTTLTRKAEDARKSNQQAQGDHLELNNSDKVVKFRQENILQRGPGISEVSVDDCDHGGTDSTILRRYGHCVPLLQLQSPAMYFIDRIV